MQITLHLFEMAERNGMSFPFPPSFCDGALVAATGAPWVACGQCLVLGGGGCFGLPSSRSGACISGACIWPAVAQRACKTALSIRQYSPRRTFVYLLL